MDELKDLKKDIEDAVGKLAAEYGYTKDFQAKLKEIEEKEPDKAIREIKKALRILRWVGRAERRADTSEKRIISDLKKLDKYLSEEQKQQEGKLLNQLSVTEAKLVKAASIFTGDLRDELLKIQTDEQLLKKVEENEKIKADLQRLFEETQTEVAELMKWISSTEALLKQIKEFEENLEKLAA